MPRYIINNEWTPCEICGGTSWRQWNYTGKTECDHCAPEPIENKGRKPANISHVAWAEEYLAEVNVHVASLINTYPAERHAAIRKLCNKVQFSAAARVRTLKDNDGEPLKRGRSKPKYIWQR